MKTISLYSILFEAEDSTSIIDPKDIASDIATSVGDMLKPQFDILGKRLEKQSKEVSTTSLSTSGTKPASGSRESRSDKKLDQIVQAQTAEKNKTETENKDLRKDLENIKSQVGNLTKMAKNVQ